MAKVAKDIFSPVRQKHSESALHCSKKKIIHDSPSICQLHNHLRGNICEV